MENDYLTRKAHLDDVKAMHGLLLACAQKGLLLPRALIYLYGHIRNFFCGGGPGRRNRGLLRPGTGLGGSGRDLFPGGA